jgi:hypothetical protein
VMDVDPLELVLEFVDLETLCGHSRVTAARLFAHVVDNKLRVASYVQPLDAKFGGHSKTVE